MLYRSCRLSAPAAASCLPRSSRGASARCRSLSCRRSSSRVRLSLTATSCRPSAPAAASCLPRSRRGASALWGGSACLGRVRRPEDRCRSPPWPSFNELLLQMICKFESRWLFPAGPDCVQFEAALLRSVALPPFPSKRDSRSVNESNVSCTQAEPSHLCHPEACLHFQV